MPISWLPTREREIESVRERVKATERGRKKEKEVKRYTKSERKRESSGWMAGQIGEFWSINSPPPLPPKMININ